MSGRRLRSDKCFIGVEAPEKIFLLINQVGKSTSMLRCIYRIIDKINELATSKRTFFFNIDNFIGGKNK